MIAFDSFFEWFSHSVHIIFRLIDNLNTIIEFVIFVLFLWSLLVICIAGIIIQTELVEFKQFHIAFLLHLFLWMFHLCFHSKLSSNPSTAGILISTLMICWTLLFLFFCCELGEMVANRLNSLDNELCRCDWHVFSVEMRRFYIITMCNTQQATIIRGYGNMVCTRDSFKKVSFIQMYVIEIQSKIWAPNELKHHNFRLSMEHFLISWCFTESLHKNSLIDVNSLWGTSCNANAEKWDMEMLADIWCSNDLLTFV